MTTIKTTALEKLFLSLLDANDPVAIMLRTMKGDDIEAAAEELAKIRRHLTETSTSATAAAQPASSPVVAPEIAQAIRAAMGFDIDGEALRAMVQEVIKEEVANVDLDDLARDAVLHAMRDVDMDAITKDVCEEVAGSAVAEHVEDAVSQAAESAVNDADLDAAIAEHLDNNLDADMVKEAVESALVRRKMVLTFGE